MSTIIAGLPLVTIVTFLPLAGALALAFVRSDS
ncbi:MAG: hypothetical protein H6P95_1186, partial [Candidatus Aminicenantes bacterium]|nr:hypothetical protein [Candidatus Aminicenantes bacterium]